MVWSSQFVLKLFCVTVLKKQCRGLPLVFESTTVSKTPRRAVKEMYHNFNAICLSHSIRNICTWAFVFFQTKITWNEKGLSRLQINFLRYPKWWNVLLMSPSKTRVSSFPRFCANCAASGTLWRHENVFRNQLRELNEEVVLFLRESPARTYSKTFS